MSRKQALILILAPMSSVVLLLPALIGFQSEERELQAFRSAVERGDIRAVRSFLEGGMNPNAKVRRFNPAWKWIFHRTMNPQEPRGAFSDHILCYAVDANHIQIAEVLLDAGADPNGTTSSGTGALLFASSRGNVQMTELLLSRGADPCGRDKDGSNFFPHERGNPAEIMVREGCERIQTSEGGS
jgi:hypothetical protein